MLLPLKMEVKEETSGSDSALKVTDQNHVARFWCLMSPAADYLFYPFDFFFFRHTSLSFRFISQAHCKIGFY